MLSSAYRNLECVCSLYGVSKEKPFHATNQNKFQVSPRRSLGIFLFSGEFTPSSVHSRYSACP